jgi:hypothetical protein
MSARYHSLANGDEQTGFKLSDPAFCNFGMRLGRLTACSKVGGLELDMDFNSWDICSATVYYPKRLFFDDQLWLSNSPG